MRYPLALVLAFGQTPESLVLVCEVKENEELEVVGIERLSDLFGSGTPPVGLCHRVRLDQAKYFPLQRLFQYYDQRKFVVKVANVDGVETLKVSLVGNEIDCASFTGNSNPLALVSELETAWSMTMLEAMERQRSPFLKPTGTGGVSNVVLRVTTPFTNQEIKGWRFLRSTTS